MLRTGYIVSWRADLFWFLGLPFLAIVAALASQQWLPFVALASINLWITIPHHFATWLRTYGFSEDWQRWRVRLILVPLLLYFTALLGIQFAPLTLFLVVMLWDHQHSIMQQYGFARIYDFKSQAGSSYSGRFDLMLHWILYVNMLLTAPLFTTIWLRELYRFHIPLSVELINTIQTFSWCMTGFYLCVYAAHLIWCHRTGYSLNPVKYAFIGSSFFLWYYASWHTASVLVFGIAHRLMHGLQYIFIVYWYLRRKTEPQSRNRSVVARLVSAGNVKIFLVACLLYAVTYQLLVGEPLDLFGFGIVNFSDRYGEIPEIGLERLSHDAAYDLYAAALIESIAVTHYYFDSFIWKVKETETQEGL